MDMKGSHFFKIISSYTIQNQCITVPKKFINKSAKELSDVVVLKVPSSKEWDVELRKEEGQVWFHNGLHEFMEYHSISVGHILVFRYEGNSRFNVVILDVNASEIEYPCDIYDTDEPSNRRNTAQKRRILNQDKDRGKKIKLWSGNEMHGIKQEGKEANFLSWIESKQGTPARKSSTSHQQQARLLTKSWGLALSKGKESAILAARAFTSNNPYFTVIMRRSFVSGRSILGVPSSFNQYLEGAVAVTLRVSDGKKWQVNCTGTYQIRMGDGWKKFALDNHLKEDDVCIFELVDEKLKELKVYIFRVIRDQQKSNASHSKRANYKD